VNWREGFFTGHVRHVKEGLEMEQLSRNGRLWKQSVSFIGLHKGNLRHLAREGSANMFIGLGYCPLTRYNPELLPASILDVTP
jgi:hypothetical protein